MIDEILTHPVQTNRHNRNLTGKVPQVVSMKAYEVYCHLYGKQEAMVTGCCRGGFGANELIAFQHTNLMLQNQLVRMVIDA